QLQRQRYLSGSAAGRHLALGRRTHRLAPLLPPALQRLTTTSFSRLQRRAQRLENQSSRPTAKPLLGFMRTVPAASLRLGAFAALSSLWASSSLAAVLAGWDVHSLPGGTDNFGPSPLGASVTDSHLTVGGLTRGGGVGTTGGSGAARGWGGND